MEVFLTRVTQQAVNYAIRSGISITANYAIAQASRLLKNVKGAEREELLSLQQRLQGKIRVISPAIDMIELIAARGNTSLESAMSLTKALRYDIQSLAQRLEKAAAVEELARSGAISAKTQDQNDLEIKRIIQDIKIVLDRIEGAVPLMNLAITTSGASLSTSLPSTVSPSRLLQASTFLTACDTQYSMTPSLAVQVGPTFTLSMYMLFASHLRPQNGDTVREMTWKEVLHKTRLKLRRVPMDLLFSPGEGEKNRLRLPAEARADEFAYQVLIIEDLDDGRVHLFEEGEPKPEDFEGVSSAGIREIVPIHQISKIFFADTGKMLNIGSEGETNHPVLLLKRDADAVPPRGMLSELEMNDVDHRQHNFEGDEEDVLQAQLDVQLNGDGSISKEDRRSLVSESASRTWKLPPDLDPEWLAFEVYNEDEEVDSDPETEPPSPIPQPSRVDPADLQLIAGLNLHSNAMSPAQLPKQRQITQSSSSPLYVSTSTVSNPLFNNIRSSLSLLETLLRLMSLQQFQQQSHLSITDELLNFFLEESSTTGAGGDEQHRQRIRAEARRKVGWDPYDESPLKRRGEDYQYTSPSDWKPQHAFGRYRSEDIEGSPLSPGGRPGGFQLRTPTQDPPVLPGKASSYLKSRGLASGKQASTSDISAGHGRSTLPRRPATDYPDEGVGDKSSLDSGRRRPERYSDI